MTPSKIERAEGGVPEWAVKRACELTNIDGSTYSPEPIERQGVLCTSIGLAFARYIAEHENAPSPAQALNEIIENRYQWMNTGPFIIAELADRGFTIVPTEQVAK